MTPMVPALIWITLLALMRAQAQTIPDWQTAAGGKMAFEVASVKLDPGPARPSNFPLDSGSAYTPGDRLSADLPVLSYIQFAWKVRLSQRQREFILDRFPKWIGSDHYAIEAKAGAHVSKDQMRLMMQSLLADRFHLAVHFENQDTAVLALKLIKPGQTGPKLRPHGEGPPCEGGAGPAFPSTCHQLIVIPNGQRLRAGERDVTIKELADALPALGRLDRPVVDQTGLAGEYDYDMEWTVESNPAGAGNPASAADPDSPTFLEMLREQLGLKLESARTRLQVLVIDRIDRPSEN